MKKKLANTVAIFTSIFIASSGFCAPLNADFTKANPNSEKTKDMPESRLQDQNYKNQDKEFKTSQYTPPTDAKRLEEQKYKGNNSAIASNFESKRYDDKKYTPPELKFFDKNFTDEDKKSNLKNLNNDLNKDYEGSIDVDKRNKNDAYMKEFLAHTQEKSMQEINKYMFRSSHSSDPGIKSLNAGSQIHSDKDDTSAVEDFLFGTKRVSGSPVNFKKSKNVGTIADRSIAEAQNPASTSRASSQTSFAPNVKILPPVINGQKSTSTNMPKERKIKVAEKEVDMGNTNLFAPRAQGMATGKYKIKVEVSQPQ